MSEIPVNQDYYGTRSESMLTPEQRRGEHYNPFGKKWTWQSCRPSKNETVRTLIEQLFYLRTGKWMHKEGIYIQDGKFFKDGKPCHVEFDN